MSILQASRIIAAAMLLLALFDMPDAYYSALRLVVSAVAVVEIFQIQRSDLSQGKKTAWTLGFSGLAIVFNPFLPLEMERETWRWFDIIGAVLLFRTNLLHSKKHVLRVVKVIAISAGLIFLVFLGVLASRHYSNEIESRKKLAAEQQARKIRLSNIPNPTKEQTEKWERLKTLRRPSWIKSDEEILALMKQIDSEPDKDVQFALAGPLRLYDRWLKDSEIYRKEQHFRLLFSDQGYSDYLLYKNGQWNAVKGAKDPKTSEELIREFSFLSWRMGREVSKKDFFEAMEDYCFFSFGYKFVPDFEKKVMENFDDQVSKSPILDSDGKITGMSKENVIRWWKDEASEMVYLISVVPRIRSGGRQEIRKAEAASP